MPSSLLLELLLAPETDFVLHFVPDNDFPVEHEHFDFFEPVHFDVDDFEPFEDELVDLLDPPDLLDVSDSLQSMESGNAEP